MPEATDADLDAMQQRTDTGETESRVMGDYATVAARRVCERLDQHATAFIPDVSPWQFGKLCARESLAAVREWYEREKSRLDADATYFAEVNDGAALMRVQDQQSLLRGLAPLIYRPIELEARQ